MFLSKPSLPTQGFEWANGQFDYNPFAVLLRAGRKRGFWANGTNGTNATWTDDGWGNWTDDGRNSTTSRRRLGEVRHD